MNYSIRTHPSKPLVTAKTPTGAVLLARFNDRQTALDTASKLRRDARAGNGIRRVKGWETVYSPKHTWKLKGRKVSVRLDNDGYRLVIGWSAGLRLEGIAAIKDEDTAVFFAKCIMRRGEVRLEYWKKVFPRYTQD